VNNGSISSSDKAGNPIPTKASNSISDHSPSSNWLISPNLALLILIPDTYAVSEPTIPSIVPLPYALVSVYVEDLNVDEVLELYKVWTSQFGFDLHLEAKTQKFDDPES